jgi:hypothetical protein
LSFTFLQDVHDVHLLSLEAQSAALGAREQKQVVRDPREAVGRLRRGVDRGPQLFLGTTRLRG